MTRSLRLAYILAGICSVAATASAAVYQAQIDTSKVGTVKQADVPAANGPSGASSCCPTATGNAFAYLQNQFPAIYGTSLVASDSYNDIKTTATTLASYMSTSYISATQPRNWVSGEVNFLESVAPGKTIYGGMGNFGISTATYPWYVNADPTFSFLFNELVQGAAIELGMLPTSDNPGHVVTLTGLSWNDANNDGIIEPSEGATMTYVDPGDGSLHTNPIWQLAAGGTIHTDYFVRGQDSGYLVIATSEVAVPEVGTLAMLGVGAASLLSRRRHFGGK